MTLHTKRKVVVVGAGAVGSTYCYALAQSGSADEIVLLDKNENLARGHVLDIAHGQPFLPATIIREGTTKDYGDAHLIVITAGAAQKPGQTRLELLNMNARIMRNIIADIVTQNATAVIVVVSNPVDIMTYVAIETAGDTDGRILGSGTVLDSARLRHLMSLHCNIDVHNIHAYVLGEHGDSEFAAWSMTHIAGMPMDDFCPICGSCDDWQQTRETIEQQVRESAYHIIDYKGATCFGVGMALMRITKAILRGERSVLTVSTKVDGQFGISDVCLSVPCIIAENGVEKIIESSLPKNESNALKASADILKKAIAQLDGDEGEGDS